MFNAEDRKQARERVGHVLERLASVAPKVCHLLEDGEEKLIAFYLLTSELLEAAFDQPLERVNTESAAAQTSSGSSPTTPQ